MTPPCLSSLVDRLRRIVAGRRGARMLGGRLRLLVLRWFVLGEN